MPLDPTIAGAVSAPVVRASLLADLEFADDPRRYWLGFGPLLAGGVYWEGTAGLARISGLSAPIGTTAQQVTFSLSGVDARTVALAKSQSARVKGRPATVFLQLFDPDWQTLGDPIHLWSGAMDLMTYRIAGGGLYEVSLSAESIWAGRRKPAFGFYTDADQQARHPGDRGLEQIAGLAGKTINWPL